MTHTQTKNKTTGSTDGLKTLQKNEMMSHLIASLQAGKDIGQYGRLVFTMVARHFLDESQLEKLLRQDPSFTDDDATALYEQVDGKDYSPPSRQKILEFQAQQDFPILPNPEDPDAGNVYRDLPFPEEVYEHIQAYRREKAHSEKA